MSNAPIPDVASDRAAAALAAVEARRAEIAQYDNNIAMYESVRDSLPAEWPEHLAHLKNVRNHHDAVKQADDADIELLSQLLMREQCVALRKTEILERTKSASILAALEAQLP